eukprot:TRINITY_DN3236_c0_g1_i1.p1 TRINITY_DN3236_c0_g1~~TRINITY_DN3236_c0_g1_i1.p1  ORF type:complete len:425 (-),score=83.95 TRINITY_DN3236_c0_g1_i1:92-1366(-)
MRQSNLMNTSKIGTFRYMAPEVVNGEAYDIKVDVYSFAMVLSEVMTRKSPFSNYSFDSAAIQAVFRGERPTLPDECPAEVSELIHQCWDAAADKRPAFVDILPRVQTLKEHCKTYPPLTICGPQPVTETKITGVIRQMRGQSEVTASTTLTEESSDRPRAFTMPTSSSAGLLESTSAPAISPQDQPSSDIRDSKGSVAMTSSSQITNSNPSTSVTDSTSAVASSTLMKQPTLPLIEIDAPQALFGQKASITYEEFERGLVSLLQASPTDVKIVYNAIKSADNLIEKQKFVLLLQYFSPLTIEEQHTNNDPDFYYFIHGTKLSQIARLISTPWFHSFLLQPKANELLITSPPGSYLLRFSSQAGKFTLSLHCDGKIQHVLISLVPLTSATKGFQLQGNVHIHATLRNLIASCSFLTNPIPHAPLI